jgi:hypothetical protein
MLLVAVSPEQAMVSTEATPCLGALLPLLAAAVGHPTPLTPPVLLVARAAVEKLTRAAAREPQAKEIMVALAQERPNSPEAVEAALERREGMPLVVKRATAALALHLLFLALQCFMQAAAAGPLALEHPALAALVVGVAAAATAKLLNPERQTRAEAVGASLLHPQQMVALVLSSSATLAFKKELAAL